MSFIDQRLALALEAAKLGTWSWDIASGVSTWDVRLEELHGLPPGGFGGTFEDWVAALHEDDRSECLARVERALADPGPYVLVHRTIWPDGSVHHIECRGTVVTDEEGIPVGTAGVAIDVSERERSRARTSEALARERELVEAFQQALLPTSPPNVPGTEIAARYIAAQRDAAVGGDWYALLPLPHGRLGVAIGDVAGHGINAVAEMAASRFSLRALALADSSPDRVLQNLNQVIRVFHADAMITALYGVIDPATHTFIFANAGHVPALLRHANNATTWLDEQPDPPLGVAACFRLRQANLEPGCAVILCTDGLIERRGESIDTGLERLRRAVETGPSTPRALCCYLESVMPSPQSTNDDTAIVVIAVGGVEPHHDD